MPKKIDIDFGISMSKIMSNVMNFMTISFFDTLRLKKVLKATSFFGCI